LKIGLIIYGSLDTLSGGYLYDRQLVAHLRQAGCRVEIIALPWRNYLAHLSDNFNTQFATALGRANYDLLLQDELNHPSLAWLNDRIRAHTSAPMIAIVHHLRGQESHPRWFLPLYRRVEARYLQSVDGFIYNSRTSCKLVQAITGPTRPGHIAYPAADHIQPPPRAAILARIAQRAAGQAPLQVIFVGNLIPRKGLHTLLAALQPLPHATWHLHVVGSSTVDVGYANKMRALAIEMGIAPHMTWHGRISDAQLHALLQSSDCFVLPSYEGFGIAYLEAMAFGLPSIALTTGAAHEIILHAHNGFLIAPNDAIALTNYLALFSRDRNRLGQMARAARQTYDSHPTWQQSMVTVHQWLREIHHTKTHHHP
jgi:glycosyltransferase involved in cell wall biosynthesis